MSLPIRTTLEDAIVFCSYLKTKPTGATISNAKAVLPSKVLDGRKMSAYKMWGFVEDDDDRYRLSERGRKLAKDDGIAKPWACAQAVSSVPAYRAIVERAVHRSEPSLTATEVAAHWFDHFKSDSSENDKILNDQAICFFHLAQGADLGKLVVGRKGGTTRFEFHAENCRSFVDGEEGDPALVATAEISVSEPQVPDEAEIIDESSAEETKVSTRSSSNSDLAENNRVFITHGKNTDILGQVKELVVFGKFEPVISKENETVAKPVPDKVMDDMRSCSAAVIHVGNEGNVITENGDQVAQINSNVLIEIGAAMALYGRNFVLLVEEGVNLPSNLRGLYECRYSGDELNMKATMKLLKTFNEFREA